MLSRIAVFIFFKRGMLSVNMADFQMASNTSIMQMDRNNGFDENERRGSPAL